MTLHADAKVPQEIQLPAGFSAAAVHCGVKHDDGKLDLALIVSDRPATAAGVYTTNLVFAAPVAWDRERTPGADLRVVVANSGNANACTGERGLDDARQMARLAAAVVGAKAEQALVLSTGVIGHFLPMEKIAAGIGRAGEVLSPQVTSLHNVSRAIMTTDSRPKLSGRSVLADGRNIQITGVAKGAAMIGPKMATMLAVVMTDAPLNPTDAQSLLLAAVEDSFNCISVEGHMSTNDTVLLVANGAAGGKPLAGPTLETFATNLNAVCMELARAIPEDGEGATHLITLDVSGCADRDAALRIAKTVADSALVKTAIAGADPNWGRIVSAAGYSGVAFNPAGVDLKVNDYLLYERGAPVAFDAATVSKSIRDHRDTRVELSFREGSAQVRFWTTDLTAEYVRLNADYTT